MGTSQQRETIMKNGQSVKQVVEQTVQHYISMAEKQHGRTFNMPTIEYFHKGSKGGHANLTRWMVGFNAGLLEDNLQRYMVRTIPHEVAHLVVYAVHGQEFTRGGKRIIHGDKFKAQMRAFGCETTRCHTMDTSKVRQKKRTTTKHPVKCACGWTASVGKIRANKILRGTEYRHRATCPPITLI